MGMALALSASATLASTNVYHLNRRFEPCLPVAGVPTAYKVIAAISGLTEIVRAKTNVIFDTNNTCALEYESVALGYDGSEAAWAAVLDDYAGEWVTHSNKLYDNVGWVKGGGEVDGTWAGYLWLLQNYAAFRTSPTNFWVSPAGKTNLIEKVLVGTIGDYGPMQDVVDVGPTNWGADTPTNFLGSDASTDVSAHADFTTYYRLLVPKVELRELSFTNNHTIKSDDGATDYTFPHWDDPNGDGNAADGHAYPLCFTRNTKMKLTAGKWHIEPANPPVTIKIKGDGPGQLDFPETTGTVSGNDVIISNVECSTAFANEVDIFDPISIAWQCSFDGGATWCNAGTSTNRVYVTWTNSLQTSPRYTLLYVGCDAADGTGGAVGVDDDYVLDKVWAKLQTKTIHRASDGVLLTYYGFYDANTNGIWNPGTDTDRNDPGSCTVTDAEGLISSANGQCHSWAHFMNEVMRAQGLASINGVTNRRVAVVVKAGNAAFSVKNWAKTGASPRKIIDFDAGVDGSTHSTPDPAKDEAADTAGASGQGNSPNPPSEFGNHWIAEMNGKYYDPSYGIGPYTDFKKYEDDAFAGNIGHVGADYFLTDLPADNGNGADHSDEINDYTPLAFP